MTETSTRPSAPAPASSTPATRLRAFQAAAAASVSLVAIATLAVEATPHPRGIGFSLPLRHAVVAPICLLVAVAAAFAHRTWSARFDRPRRALAAGLTGLAAVLLGAMAALGPPGLVAAGAPAVVAVALAALWLVPRFVERPPRSRVGRAALVLFGALEVAGVVVALVGERPAPPGPAGLAFDIPRTMFDVEHKFVELPGGARVHYVDEGQGDTLLFLHGNPSWSFQWRDLIRGLRDTHRCVALDFPGFGLSQAPAGFGFSPREESAALEAFVDRLGLRDLTLVMQDWGGPIGLGLAERRPELVRRVVLGSTWAWPTTTSEARGKWSFVAGGPFGEFMQINFNGIAALGLSDSIAHELPADVTDVYLRPFRPLDRRGIAAFYPGQIVEAGTYFAELEAGLARLEHKDALVFWALHDPGFPHDDLVRWQTTFPRHKTIELPDARHFFFEDAAERVIAEIRALPSPSAIRSPVAP